MRTFHTILLTAVVASAFTLLATRLLADAPADSGNPELEDRLKALEDRSANHGQQGWTTAQSSSVSAPGQRTSAGSRVTGHVVDETEEQAQTDAIMREFGNRLRAEPVAPVWAKNTEISVLEAMTSAEAKAAGVALPSDVNVECKSTLCSISATYADDGAAAEAATILAMDISGVLPQTQRRTIYRPDGTVELQIYALK